MWTSLQADIKQLTCVSFVLHSERTLIFIPFFFLFIICRGWCFPWPLCFWCMLHLLTGWFTEQHLIPFVKRGIHHGSIRLLLLAPFWTLFGVETEIFRFLSAANSSWNSCAFFKRLSNTNHFVSPPTNLTLSSMGKWSNFSFVRSSASWFFSLGIHSKQSSQSLVRKVSESSIIKTVSGYLVLIHLLTA